MTVTTVDGAADFDLNLPVKAAERYLLQVSAHADKVAISVLSLSDDDYGLLHPGGTARAACAK